MTKLVRKPLHVIEVTWGPVTFEVYADFRPATAEEALEAFRTAITAPAVTEEDVEDLMQRVSPAVMQGGWKVRDYADDCLVTREEVMAI